MMKIDAVPILADALKEYYKTEELKEICSLFEISFDDGVERPHFNFAKRMVSDIEHGNNRQFLEAIIPQLITRCDEQIARTSFERQDYHLGMRKPIQQLSEMLGEPGIPREVTVTQNRPFMAKSAVREFLENVTTELIVVDNYVGIGTLDCVHGVQTPIRLLTGDRSTSISPGFDSTLKDFVAEGHAIQVRRHPKLHDRYLIFNERCWLIGSSLKDAGKKSFNMIELVDGRSAIVREVESKWKEALPYP
jgi:hypothetical protein